MPNAMKIQNKGNKRNSSVTCCLKYIFFFNVPSNEMY